MSFERKVQLRSTDRWFVGIQRAETVWQIEEHAIRPELRGNIFFILGRERDLLIDSGWGLSSLRDAFPMIDPDRTWAIATHSHFDHIGGHHEFPIRAIHPAEADILAKPTPINTQILPFLKTIYPFQDQSEPWIGTENYHIEPARPSILLRDGMQIDLGDRSIEVIHTPGHSPGSISLWDSVNRHLFTADLLFDGPLFDEIPGANRADLLESHQRINPLSPRQVFPGHFDPFGETKMHQLIERYRQNKNPDLN